MSRMSREDCGKLLDATIDAWLLFEQAERGKLDTQHAREAAENLREVVIGIMAGDGSALRVYNQPPVTVSPRDWTGGKGTGGPCDFPPLTTVTCGEPS